MLICKVSISYDRGVAGNAARDLGLEADPNPEREDGKILRGLGTHFVSAEAAARSKELDAENNRIRMSLKQRFAFSPIPSTYIAPRKGAVREFLEGLGIRPEVRARAHEYDLTTPAEMDREELTAWSERLREQIITVRLGNTPEADQDGLACLEELAACPIMPTETALRLRELVAAGRLGSMGRMQIRRSLKAIRVPLSEDALAVTAPRRPSLPQEPLPQEPLPDDVAQFAPVRRSYGPWAPAPAQNPDVPGNA